MDYERRQPGRRGRRRGEVGEAAESGHRENAENFLARYFREMSTLSVLKPEEEFEAARKIETIEVELWDHLLGYPPLLDVVLAAVGQSAGGVKGVAALKRGARDVAAGGSSAARLRYKAQCERVAKRIYANDVDRHALFTVLADLHRIALPERVASGRGPSRANVHSRAFLRYLRGARATFNDAQRQRNEFVKANLRLVVSIARRFNHGRMPLSDLIQEGNIGLIKAVERYDYHRGYRFSTYASWWIRHSISRALADKGRTVRLPVHMIDAYHKVARARRDLSNRLGRPPTAEEVGNNAGLPIEKVEKLQGYIMEQAVSLDREVSDSDGRRFVDLMQDPDLKLPSEQVIDEALNDRVRELLDSGLKPIEADILRKRFGLSGDRELTLKEIGQTYNLSRERIRQLQEQALDKIRRALHRAEAI